MLKEWRSGLIKMKNSDSIKIINNSYVDTVNLLIKLVNCKPMYGTEGQFSAIKVVEQYLRENGWNTYIDEFTYDDIKDIDIIKKPWEYDQYYQNYTSIIRCNLYAVLDSGKPGKTLILNGHYDIDIVDKEDIFFNTIATLNCDKLEGRGTTDMLGGLCSLATVKNYLDSISWRGKVIFTAVTDEEIGGNGSIRACRWLQMKNYLNDISNVECVIAEPTGCEICYETMGFLPFSLLTKSKINHMNAEGNENNLNLIISLLKKISDLRLFDSNININIGYINGGKDASLPIDELTIKGIVATTPDCNNNFVRNELMNYCNEIYIPKMDIEAVKFEKTLFGRNISKNTIFNSSCDASVFKNFNVESAVFGPGILEQAHSKDEFIMLNQIKKYLNLLYNCIGEFLR